MYGVLCIVWCHSVVQCRQCNATLYSAVLFRLKAERVAVAAADGGTYRTNEEISELYIPHIRELVVYVFIPSTLPRWSLYQYSQPWSTPHPPLHLQLVSRVCAASSRHTSHLFFARSTKLNTDWSAWKHSFTLINSPPLPFLPLFDDDYEDIHTQAPHPLALPIQNWLDLNCRIRGSLDHP